MRHILKLIYLAARLIKQTLSDTSSSIFSSDSSDDSLSYSEPISANDIIQSLGELL